MAKKSYKLKIVALAIGLYLILCLLVYAGNSLRSHKTEVIKPVNSASKTYEEPELAPIAREIGIPSNTVNIKYSQAHGGDLNGIYDAPNTILINKDASSTATVLAHEYMHYVWSQKLSYQEKTNLKTSLYNMYDNDSGMQNRLKGYVLTDDTKPTELFAYYCTENNDSWLNTDVLNICNKYINRSTLTFKR